MEVDWALMPRTAWASLRVGLERLMAALHSPPARPVWRSCVVLLLSLATTSLVLSPFFHHPLRDLCCHVSFHQTKVSFHYCSASSLFSHSFSSRSSLSSTSSSSIHTPNPTVHGRRDGELTYFSMLSCIYGGMWLTGDTWDCRLCDATRSRARSNPRQEGFEGTRWRPLHRTVSRRI